MLERDKINEEFADEIECFECRRSALIFQHRGNV